MTDDTRKATDKAKDALATLDEMHLKWCLTWAIQGCEDAIRKSEEKVLRAERFGRDAGKQRALEHWLPNYATCLAALEAMQIAMNQVGAELFAERFVAGMKPSGESKAPSKRD